ncbi:MAG: DMT family transporter [Rhodospirillales bacterium]|jgi:drug/metabolite transporter (DMT)-like permease|nr:DMT family transporter [Rhodospirillales bacterium]
MPAPTSYARGLALTLAGVVVLSPDALLVRLVDGGDWTIVFYRGLLTALALAAFVVLRRRPVVGLRQWRTLVVGAFFGISTTCFVHSVDRTLAANTLVILAATPLVAAVFSRLFLGEHQPSATWIAITVVSGGIALIFLGSPQGGHLLGNLLAVTSAAAMAANLVVIRNWPLESPLPALALGGLLAAVASFPFATLAISAGDAFTLAVMGLVVQALAFGLIFIGPRHLPAAEVALLMLLESILGPLWVWLALGERPTAMVVAAGALIITTLGIHAVVSLRRNGCRG